MIMQIYVMIQNCCQAWISKEDRLARWDEDQRESNWQKNSKCCKYKLQGKNNYI